MIEADRRALADYLAGLSPAEWTTTSLCTDWNVHEVTAHLLVVPLVSKGKVMLGFLGAGFNLDKFSAKQVAALVAEKTPDQMVQALRDHAAARNVPPGMKPINVLGDLVVHANDISEPVGKPLDLPAEHYVVALDAFKDLQMGLGSKKRIAGLQLRAVDTDWSHGEGPLVKGTAKDLVMAMTGRPSAIDRLSGDGVDTLRSRTLG